MKNFLLKNKRLIFILFPSILILWKLLLFIDLPYPNLDGVWQLSHTFSILNGNFLESSFAFDYWIPFQFPPAHGFFMSIFYFVLYPVSKTYSIFFYNILFISSAVLLSNIYLKQKNITSYLFKLLILISLITTTDIFNNRCELTNINLMLILLIVVDSHKDHLSIGQIAIASFLTAICGLIHPLGGFFMICIFTAISFKRGFLFKNYIQYYLFTLFLVCAIYLPIILLDYQSWYKGFIEMYLLSRGQDFHKFSYLFIFKYFLLSPFSFLPYLYVIFSKSIKLSNIIKELLLLLLFVFLLSLFGRYYYFPYIFVFILWRLSNMNFSKELRINYSFILIALILSPVFTHYIPTLSQVLNREYVQNFKNIVNYVENQNYNSEYNKVFISTPIAMPIIEYQNSCMLEGPYPKDIIFTFNNNDLGLIANSEYFNYFRVKYKVEPSDLIIKEIFKPVSEKYPFYFRSKFEDRHMPIGLYEVTRK